MSKKLFITTMILALTFAISCDNKNKQESANTGAAQTDTQETAMTDASEGEVIDSQSRVVEQRPAQLEGTNVEEGNTEVQYTTKRRVTETVLKEQDIPTIQICETKANINEMDKNDFTALGFDSQVADKIVQTREQRGQFSSVDDLSQIEGVSGDMFSQIRNDLGVMQAQEEN